MRLCNIITLLLFVRRRRTRPLLPTCNETNRLFELRTFKPSIRPLYNIVYWIYTENATFYVRKLFAYQKTQHYTPYHKHAHCAHSSLDAIWQNKCKQFMAISAFSSFQFFFIFLSISNDPINDFACEIENSILRRNLFSLTSVQIPLRFDLHNYY